MIEQLYEYATSEEKKIEILIENDDVMINHAILPPGDALPEHFSNSDIHLIIIRGTLSAQLGDTESHLYTKGNIIHVPCNIKMNISNAADDTLEFFIIKAPHPKTWNK